MSCAQCGQWLADGDVRCPRCGAPAHGAAIGPLPGAAVPAAAPAAPARYAGFWRRFWTGVVDALVLFFPAAIVRVLSGADASDLQTAWSQPALLRAEAINLLLYWLYCALLESSRAQGTLGQQLLGLRVCDDRLQRISFVRASGRFWGQFLSAFTCGIGYLLNLWTRKRQTLHDLAAGCVLVRAEPPDPAPGGRS